MASADMVARLRSFRKHWLLRSVTEIDDLTDEELRKFERYMAEGSSVTGLNADIIARITHRRRQIFVHSTIYYRHCTSVIDDATFDRWAYELAELQREYPEESAAAPFAAEFSGWDGTTGYDLSWNAWATKAAERLIAGCAKRR